ncbi:terpene synthase family protein [Streptomyces niveus]|uniref:terpene synthase family protein n=1 Tax=Streptomyces niveus TaxID=193462 RepID=UPI00343AECA0
MKNTSGVGPSALPLPDLMDAFPGPFPTSSHADQVEQHLVQWAGEFELLAPPGARRALCGITGQGIARVLPDADLDSLVLCAELFLWLVAFDDAHGEATAARNPARLVDRVGELVCVLAEDEARMTHSRPDCGISSHASGPGPHRPSTSGSPGTCATTSTVFVRTIIATMPIVLSYELLDEQRSSGPVRQLETAVAHLTGWVNDLASYARETDLLRARPLSLPTLLMGEHDLDLPKAFETASRMCEEQAAVARERISELSSNSSPPLTLHAQTLEHIARSFIWHVGHDRHRRFAGSCPSCPPRPTTGSPSCP